LLTSKCNPNIKFAEIMFSELSMRKGDKTHTKVSKQIFRNNVFKRQGPNWREVLEKQRQDRVRGRG